MRFDSTALVWGVIFAMLAGLGLWAGTGHRLDWSTISVVAPLVLIAAGALALVLSRSRQRRSRSSRKVNS